jgi:hypothetical protein
LRVKDALQLAVIQHHGAIISAQVGAAKSTEKEWLMAEAISSCDLISDHMFWNGLESVVGNIEPICYGTNINQKDLMCANQVLLTIVGIYLHFLDHPEVDVAKKMEKHLEKWWKDCDQPLFLLALILNPFEGLSHFGPNANLNHFKCNNLLIGVHGSITPDHIGMYSFCL